MYDNDSSSNCGPQTRTRYMSVLTASDRLSACLLMGAGLWAWAWADLTFYVQVQKNVK